MRFMKILKSLKMLFIGTLLAASLALASCGGGETTSCTVILHAGGGADGLRYLNAQETFYTYYDLGYRVFEYDLKLSSDGRLIGTHSGEHLSGFYDGMDYQSFLSLRLSNGMEWSLDEKKFYHTDSDTSVIREYFFDKESGDIAYTGREVRVPGVDGFTIGSDGCLYIGCWGRGHVAVVDTETLIDAQKNPDKYGNLLVRIGGYSDYFTKIPRFLRKPRSTSSSYIIRYKIIFSTR